MTDTYVVIAFFPGDTETFGVQRAAAEGEPAINLTGYTGTLEFRATGSEAIILTKTVAVESDHSTFLVPLTVANTVLLGSSNASRYLFRTQSADLSDVKTILTGPVKLLKSYGAV